VANATSFNLGTISADANGLATGNLSINGVGITLGAVQAGDANGALAQAINAVSNQTGVTATVNASSEMVLTAADGRNIQTQTTVVGDALFSNLDLTAAGNRATIGTITMSSDSAIVVGTGTAAATQGMTIAAGTVNVTTTNAMSNVDVSTQNGANDALSNIDRALSQIDSIRGDLGAVQNRFESTIANQQNVAENLSAARSRILDADIAEETSAMTKSNILQQAGVAILAQANQAPQLALSLLQ
jgi:flagellin